MTDNVTRFSGFTALDVADHFKLSAEDTVGRSIVNFIYGITHKDLKAALFKDGKVGRNKHTLGSAIEELEPKFEILRKYAPTFFAPDYPVDHDALAVAVLCDSHRTYEHQKTKFQIPGISPQSMETAHSFWEERNAFKATRSSRPEILFMEYMSVFSLLQTYEKSKSRKDALPELYEITLSHAINNIRPLYDLKKEMCRDLMILTESADRILKQKEYASMVSKHGHPVNEP